MTLNNTVGKCQYTGVCDKCGTPSHCLMFVKTQNSDGAITGEYALCGDCLASRASLKTAERIRGMTPQQRRQLFRDLKREFIGDWPYF